MSRFDSILIPIFFLGDFLAMVLRFEPITRKWYVAADRADLDSVGVAVSIWGPFFIFWILFYGLVWCLSRFFKVSQAWLGLPMLVFSVLNTLVLTPALFGELVFDPGHTQDALVKVMKIGPWAVISVLTFFVTILLVHIFRKFKGLNRFSRIVAATGLYAILCFLAIPPVFLADLFIPKVSNLKVPTVLLVGLDGLSFDSYTAEPWLQDEEHPYLEYERKYLKPRGSYTPIAKTQLTYVSLLSGVSPEAAGIDTIFGSRLRDFDKILSQSKNAAIIERRNLKVSYLGSDQEYAYFKKVKSYFSSDGTAPGIQNTIGPNVFRSPFFFGFINNWIGFYLFPEIVGNSSYADTFWPIFFVSKVVSHLNNPQPGASEHLILSHLVKAHWPGSLQWPFYWREGKYISNYGTLTSKVNLSPTRSEKDVLRNKIVYDHLKKQILTEYLDPLFQRLQEYEDANLSVYVMSDHGEEFFSDSPLPLSKTPRHGTSVLFEKNSNRLYFRSPKDFTSDYFSIQSLMSLIFGDEDALPTQGQFVEMGSDRWIHRTHPYQIFNGGCPACSYRFAGRIPVLNLDGEELVRTTRERKWVVNEKEFLLIPSDFGYFFSPGTRELPLVLRERLEELGLKRYVPGAFDVKTWAGYSYLDDKTILDRLYKVDRMSSPELVQYLIAAKANLYRNLGYRKFLDSFVKASVQPQGYIEPILASYAVEVCPFLSDLIPKIDKKWHELVENSCLGWREKRPYLGDAYAYFESSAGKKLQAKIFELIAEDPSKLFNEIQNFERSWFSELPIPFLGAPLHAFVLWQLSKRGLHKYADQYALDMISSYPLCWPLLRILWITESGKKLFAEKEFLMSIRVGSLNRAKLLLLYRLST